MRSMCLSNIIVVSEQGVCVHAIGGVRGYRHGQVCTTCVCSTGKIVPSQSVCGTPAVGVQCLTLHNVPVSSSLCFYLPICAVLNVGTSSQLVTFKPNLSRQSVSKLPPSVMELPFFNGRNILVAASLNGGNVLKKLVNLLRRWSAEMGMPQVAIEEDLYRLLIEKAEEFEARCSGAHILSIRPTLFGERHTPGVRGTVEGIGPDVPGLGQVFSAACRSLVENLLTMMPRDILQQCEVCMCTLTTAFYICVLIIILLSKRLAGSIGKDQIYSN